MQFGAAQGGRQRRAERARAAAQVDDDRRVQAAGQTGGLPDEELRTAARHEDPGVHGDPQAAELRPAKDVFEGKAGDAAVDHDGQVGGGGRGGDEQLGLVLGEDAAGDAEPRDDGGPGGR